MRECARSQRHQATIYSHLDRLITEGRAPVPLALSPHLQDVPPDRFQALRSLPVWVSATVMALVVAATWGYCKYQLAGMQHQVVDTIVAIGKITAPPAVAISSK
jgi:type VI secretion system protein ImpK